MAIELSSYRGSFGPDSERKPYLNYGMREIGDAKEAGSEQEG